MWGLAVILILLHPPRTRRGWVCTPLGASHVCMRVSFGSIHLLSPFTPILHAQRLWVSDTERNRDFIVSSCPSESSPLLPEIVAHDNQHRAIVARMKPSPAGMPQEVPAQPSAWGDVGPCSTAGPSEPSVRAQATDIATRLRQKRIAR